MQGTGLKLPCGPEVPNRLNNRKSLHTARAVPKGEPLTRDNLRICRPGTGIAPKHLESLLGRRASRDLAPDTLLGWGDLA